MAKPFKLSPFTIAVDTNALYPKDITNVVGPKFVDTWKECSKLTRLQLVIPEVVRGERLYQMSIVAQQAIENAAKSFERLGKVSGCTTPKPPEFQEAKEGIERRFDSWAKEFGAKVAEIPYEKIDWKKVVSDAIWRVKPFTPPAEEKDSEKGFRDYLILETLNELVHRTEEQVVFISKDALLRDAAVERFTAKEFATYEDLTGFASYLKLAQEKVNQAFAQAVLQKVPGIFFTPNNAECVYNKFEVGARIAKQFSRILNFLFEAPLTPQPSNPLAQLAQAGIYSPISEEKVFIDSTEIVQSPMMKEWQWKTRVRFVRLFQKEFPQPAFMQGLAFLNETIRIQGFDVFWTAAIDAEANFSNLSLTNITSAEQTREPGWTNRHKYGFNQVPPSQAPQ